MVLLNRELPHGIRSFSDPLPRLVLVLANKLRLLFRLLGFVLNLLLVLPPRSVLIPDLVIVLSLCPRLVPNRLLVHSFPLDLGLLLGLSLGLYLVPHPQFSRQFLANFAKPKHLLPILSSLFALSQVSGNLVFPLDPTLVRLT